MTYIRVFLMVLSLAFIVAGCAPKKSTTGTMVSLEDAQQDCFQQSQSMFNHTIDPASPDSNSYFSNCMQTNYGYSLEEIEAMNYHGVTHDLEKVQN